MNKPQDSKDRPDAPDRYTIRVKGHLSYPWANWFDGVTITQTDNGDTLITFPIIDQPALHGVLKKVRDLGLELISINRLDDSLTQTNQSKPTHTLEEKHHMSTTTMKVAIYNEYGSPDVLHTTDMAKPTPQEGEILVQVKARSINYGDLFARRGVPRDEFNMPGILYYPTILAFGKNKPKVKVLGSEFSGIVESVGSGVSKFNVGDEVYGYLGQNMGANAEYITVSQDSTVTLKPVNMSFEQATVTPYGAVTALNLLKKGNIQAGHKVLINGASGSIGAAAVQLAKHYGAEVTGVAGGPRLEYVKALGADHVIDYRQADFTQNGETYDLIIDVLGKSTFAQAKNSLTRNGIYLRASFKMRELFQMLMNPLHGGKKVICALAFESPEDLVTIKGLVEAGKYTAIVDRCYPLDQIADAHRYAENGNKRGTIAVVSQS